VGRVTGDVVSAVIEFFDGLAESKPSADASSTEAGDPSTAVLGERISRRGTGGVALQPLMRGGPAPGSGAGRATRS
jgi:hypothetical protein